MYLYTCRGGSAQLGQQPSCASGRVGGGRVPFGWRTTPQPMHYACCRRKTALFVGHAVLGLGNGGLLFDALEHLGQGGLVHGENSLCADSLHQTRDGRVSEDEPVIFGGHVDIAEADLLGGELEFGSAVGSLALLNQALFV